MTQLTKPVVLRFTDQDQERIRANHEQRIAELQDLVPAMLFGHRLVAIQKFTTSGPYTPTSGATNGFVIQCGGGGAGGGATAVGITQSVGGGGGSGTTLVDYLPSLGTGGSVVVGAGGTPVSGANGNDGADTTTTINGITRISKGGGGGGVGTQSGSPSATQAGAGSIKPGSSSGLYVNADAGGEGLITSSTGGGLGAGMRGGSGALGLGAIPNVIAATGFGAGGNGGSAVNGSAPGASGAPGVVIIVEFS